jgi:hypothetical protein
MPNAQLRKKRVDCSKLNAGSATQVSNLSRIDVVEAIWDQQWKRGEFVDEVLSITGTCKALQQLLQHKSSGYHRITIAQSITERANLRLRFVGVAPERKRPNACIDQYRHRRERSAL